MLILLARKQRFGSNEEASSGLPNSSETKYSKIKHESRIKFLIHA